MAAATPRKGLPRTRGFYVAVLAAAISTPIVIVAVIVVPVVISSIFGPHQHGPRDLDVLNRLPPGAEVIDSRQDCAGGSTRVCTLEILIREDGVSAHDLGQRAADTYRTAGIPIAPTSGATWEAPPPANDDRGLEVSIQTADPKPSLLAGPVPADAVLIRGNVAVGS